MAWITTEQLKAAVRSQLRLDPAAALPSYWDEPVTNGVTEGYNHVRRVLAGRGYTTADMEAWDEKAQWNRRAGLYYAFADANLDDDRALQQVERLWEKLRDLNTIPITVSGVAIEPGDEGGTGTSNLSYGDFDTTDDVHTIEDEL